MIKTILTILLFALPGFAQDQAEVARAAAGCGQDQVQFSVKTDGNKHAIAQAEVGKAVVYVFEEEKRDEEENRGQDALFLLKVTTRVGLDGAWVGATHDKSYFFFTVCPGEHNVWANWQSSLGNSSKQRAAAALTAEANKMYFFRTTVEKRKGHPAAVHLEPVDSAEGQFLISVSALSSSHPMQ
jgi:hypothetical protein